MNQSVKTTWGTVLIVCLALGLLLFILSSLPYESAKSIGDTISKDGSLESLTPERFRAFNQPLQFTGVFLILVGVGWGIFRKKTEAGVLFSFRWVHEAWISFLRDTRTLINDLVHCFSDRGQNLVLIGLSIIALGLRWVYLSRPTWHDEAYTITVFASQPFRYLISDYHLPNNHIFHTILVRFSMLLFGNELWAARLPVLISGVLLIPAGYILARKHYNRTVAVAAAALIAASPVLIDHSTSARGYILLALITLLLFNLGTYLLERSNLAAWMGFAVLSALGFYTIPVMLYPFGVVVVWMGLSALTRIRSSGVRSSLRFLISLLCSSLAVGLLTILFYLPVILTSGLDSITGNRWVASLSWSDFVQTVPHRVQETWTSWLTGAPVAAGYLMLFGVLVSTITHRKLSKLPVPPQIAAVLWIGAELLVQLPNPWPRIWTFLIPLVLIWGTAGLTALFTENQSRQRPFTNPSAVLAGVIVILSLVGSTVRAVEYLPFRNSPNDAESITLMLKDRLVPGDIVVVTAPNDANIEYYFMKYEISKQYYQDIKKHPFKRVYVIANLDFGQTADSVILERGPDYVFMDMNTVNLVQQWGYTALYEVYPHVDLVEKAYGVQFEQGK